MLVLPDVGSGTLTHHLDPGAWLKLLGWTTLDPRFMSKYNSVPVFFTMSCGGANMCTFQHFGRIYTGFEHICSPWSCGAYCWNVWLVDGRTWKKRCFFSKKGLLVRTGPNWTDISVLWTRFSVLSDAFQTALRKKKYVWRNKERPFHVCIVWANLPKKECHQNREMHPYVRSWVLRPTLTCPKIIGPDNPTW